MASTRRLRALAAADLRASMHDKAAAATSSFSGCFTQATGHFNKDGIRDLVVSNWDVDRITVHLGIGGGFFSAPIVFTEDRPSSLGVADFNQDGSDDFFILLYGTGDIRIMFGDGLGGFTPSGFILGHGGAFGGLVADVNNDNVDDIVVHSRTIQPGSVDGISAFINDGSGSFTRIDSIGGFTYGNLDGRQALAPGDFNGDGNIDILAG